jgi:adenylyltransferase/sulfurtransferase
MPLSSAELTRYSRHLALREIGAAGQEKLKNARVAVIGVGGLGSPAVLYLAASGVGHIGLIDGDRVDLSNLQRQVLYDTRSIGRLKVEAARERLLGLNPAIEVSAHPVELCAANAAGILSGYDIVLDGTDRFAPRYLANDACVMSGKSLISAAIHRFEGQAFTYVPDRGPCYRCLFPEAPTEGLVPNCAEAGVLGVLPGILGTIQATEAIKLIVDQGEPLIGRLLTYDALELRFGELRFARREDCAVCGTQPTITELRDSPDLRSSETLRHVRRLSAEQLQGLLQSRDGQSEGLVLIDVREPREFATGHLPEALNIPLADIERRLAELPPRCDKVFICRSGARSLTACGIAARAGLDGLSHLEGGLLAWAAAVDRTFDVAAPG